MYCIVDIETTGGNHNTGQITEIAIIKHDGNKVIDEFNSLINPGIPIPPFISNLTGITDGMVANAPKFHEVAKRIVEITKDCIFIAHNVSFDYNYIRQGFKNLGYEWKRERICTVKTSKKVLPGYKSYSLGNLCKDLGISVNDRHRAKGDADATVLLFELILKKTNGNLEELFEKEKTLKNTHPNLDIEVVKTLPKACGVYYLYDDNNNLIYIGKSKNIRSRVYAHINNRKSKRANEMADNIVKVDYTLTGSELIALLLESDEIKKHKPRFNRALKKDKSTFGLFHYFDPKGYFNLKIEPLFQSPENEVPIASFDSRQNALQKTHNWANTFQLCHKLCGLEKTDRACFQYQLKECKGACIKEESAKDYNERIGKVLNLLNYKHQNFVVVDKGRTKTEKCAIVIENGQYLGFGFFNIDDGITRPEQFKEIIAYRKENRDTKKILKGYMRKRKIERYIPF